MDAGLNSSCVLAQITAAAAAKSLQLCLTLRDPIDSSPPGSPVPGILSSYHNILHSSRLGYKLHEGRDIFPRGLTQKKTLGKYKMNEFTQ